MIYILNFLIIVLVVGTITAFLNIKFDKFFIILMLLFLTNLTIKQSIDIALWLVFLGAITIIFKNLDKISKMPIKSKINFLTKIPIIVAISTFIGSYLFIRTSNSILIFTLGILAILYGLRLIFIHFTEKEMNYTKLNPVMLKFCGIFGPIISGFLLGFIGTSLKSLKIPFAIKFGKLNLKQVYIGNVIVAAYASMFAILLHAILTNTSINYIFNNFILGLTLWISIHFISELTNKFVKDRWRKPVQILIGFVLLLVSIKVFMLI